MNQVPQSPSVNSSDSFRVHRETVPEAKKTEKTEQEVSKRKKAEETAVAREVRRESKVDQTAQSVESFRTQMKATAEAVRAQSAAYASRLERSEGEDQLQGPEKSGPQIDAEVRKAVEEANRALAERLTGGDSRLVIEPDPSSGSFVYKTVDKEGNVKAQWPRDDFLRKVEYLRDISGVLADRNI